MHGGPLLLVILLVVGIESVFCSSREAHFDGHVLCRIGNGTEEVPVRNAEVKLMEGDLCWFGVLDCDDLLALGITDAEGAFTLDGNSSENGGNIEPYLVVKACRNESSCYVKKFIDTDSGVTVKNYNYFLDDEFCQQCEGGGECKSA